jgi:beta-lactamase regulating signal transducer with metallopeptidase domain
MLAWLMYVVMVTLLLSLAAYTAERTALLRRAPSRWVWLVTILASLLLPSLMSSVSIQVPNVFTPSASQPLHALREVTTQHLSPVFWFDSGHGNVRTWRNYDALLKQAWLLISVGMTLVLAVTGAMLFIRKRRWQRQFMDGVDVYVTQDIGPAVVGLLKPRIVVPAWILQTPIKQQAMVLAHEQSHLNARDPLLFTIALCLLVAMPWNLPLWWQLHRLRRAIEIDCDARVLERGHAVEHYGETLIEVGARQSGYIGAVAAMSESASFLEERVRIMVLQPGKWAKQIAAGLGLLSLVVAAVAVQVGPPNGAGSEAGASASGERKEITLAESALPNYVGAYKFHGIVMHITSDGSHLLAQLTGQPALEIYPQSQSEFFYKAVNAQMTFALDGNGRATALTLHQNGQTINAPRMDDAAAQLREKGIQEHVRFQQPNPGSEAALKRILPSLTTDKPDFGGMAPEVASGMKQHLTNAQTILTKLGPMQSLQFKGVGDDGWDVYEAKYQNGTMHWRIAMGEDGVVYGLFLQNTL